MSEAGSPIVYGEDDRLEAYEAPSSARAWLHEAVVAFVPNASFRAAGELRADIPAWSEVDDLCPGEPFADQPAAAFCTGVLVDWDLVLTAGHCVRALALEDFSIVFGFAYEAPSVLSLTPEGVFSPAEVLDEALDGRDAESRLDHAWIRLARPALPPRRPVPVALARHALGTYEGVVAISAGGGVPLKVDTGARILQHRDRSLDYLVADSDTSYGSSGGGLFSSEGELLGVLARGAYDFEPREDGCATTIRARPSAADEHYSYAFRALTELCSRAPASTSLCRGGCGDPCAALAPLRASGGCALVAPRDARDSSLLFLALALLAARVRRRRESAGAAAKSSSHPLAVASPVSNASTRHGSAA